MYTFVPSLACGVTIQVTDGGVRSEVRGFAATHFEFLRRSQDFAQTLRLIPAASRRAAGAAYVYAKCGVA